MSKATKLLCGAVVLSALSACGTNPGDRALSGAGIGAAAAAFAFTLFETRPRPVRTD